MNFLINRKITITMLFVALSLLGWVSYRQLPVEMIPNAEFPQVFIGVYSMQDTDPQYVESQIIIPLEGAVTSVGGVEEIRSTVGSTQSSIRISFKKSVNFKLTSLKLEEKVNELAQTFPEGFRVQVMKFDLSQMTSGFMSLQVRGSGGADRVRNIVEQEIRSELENIDGIASVSVYGGREKAVEVQLNPDVCKALNLTPAGISALISQNVQEKVYVGNAQNPDIQYFVHINSAFEKVTDLENIVVAPGPVLLKDIAVIFFDMKEETTYSRVNGKDAVSVALTNDSQANIISLSHRTNDVIDNLNERLKSLDTEIVIEQNQAEIMEKNINQIVKLALMGGFLAVLILWFFLKNVRLVVIITLSIPISIYTAFNLFYAFGITVNSLTLIGITLAVGMLLDNSIVVLENVYRLSGAGYSPEQSVTQGTKEVLRSILAATLTTITVFLPFIFMDNFLVKLMGTHIGISIISTLAISLLVAMLFVPMAAYLIIKSKNSNSVFYEKVSVLQRPTQIYLVLLKTCMRHSGATVISAIALFFIVLLIALSLSLTSMQSANADRFNIRVELPTGTTLDATDKIVKTIEERLDSIPEKEELISRIQERQANLTFVLKENFEKIQKRKIEDIKSEVTKQVEGIEGEITITSGFGDSDEDMGGGSSNTVGLMAMMGIGENNERIIIKGSDFDLMQRVAEDLEYRLEQQDFIGSARVSYNRRQPEILLDFDPILLMTYGIEQTNIAQGLRSLEPDFESGSTFKAGEETYDIIIRNKIPDKEETEDEENKLTEVTVDKLRKTEIPSSQGGLHRLEDIAALDYSRGRSQIVRVNQEKQITVSYSFNRDIQSSKSLLEGYRTEIDAMIANYNLPVGIATEVVHEEDNLKEFKFLFLAAFILIFMILASVFESFTLPFVLLLSIPLAAIGSLLALVITGNSLQNTNTLMGLLILLGVVVNNSIILIDYANILRKRGFHRERALMTAGLSRVRPILITSITTIVAMFPLAMGKSEYSGLIGAPFAITVIGGLTCSTLLTLILVPTACMGLENALKWYKTLSAKIKLLHIALFIVGFVCIYLYAEGIIYQGLFTVLLITLIPGMTYFAQNSLRRAKSEIISPDESLTIIVRNLVKIYDRKGRFARQWESGIRVRERLGLSVEYHSLKDFAGSLWQFFLVGFGVYFVFFFLESKFWIFLLSFAVYAGLLHIRKIVFQYLDYRFPENKFLSRINKWLFWLIPLAVIIGMFIRLDSVNLMIIITLLWILALSVYNTSQYLYANDVKIERITGKFVGFRRWFYRLVKNIPLIGKQKKAFKALKGVSLEITTGMFGLLGPNGAGKSTLMRIICGILEQSYGSIWINGLDTRIYREELQGLIGFLPQEFGTYEHLTSYEFLDYQAILKGITDLSVRAERIEYVLKSVHLYERKDERIASFSGGMKQRIGIALILLHLPRILIVDEPTAGLDPRERIRFRNLLVELSKDRIVIFSTHIIEDISSSCNQVAVIDKGALKYFGKPYEMTGMAEGKVWQFDTDKAGFETLDKSLIIHHIQDGEIIRVRYLSEQKPTDGATLAEPNLEDAYLCLLKGLKD